MSGQAGFTHACIIIAMMTPIGKKSVKILLRLLLVTSWLLSACTAGTPTPEGASQVSGVRTAPATGTDAHTAQTNTLTPTPTALLSQTLSPFPVVASTRQPTPTISPGDSQTDFKLPGHLYAWSQGDYFTIESPFNGHGVKTTLQDVYHPERSVLLSFANYSDRIAYLTQIDQTELWIADLNLTKIEKVWSVENAWLGDVLNRDTLQMVWGPQDHTIIVTDLTDIPHTLIYNLGSKTAEYLSGACDQIGLPPVLDGLGLMCSDKETNSQVYLFGNGGQKESSPGAALQGIHILNWAFSPDGARVLYATDQNALVVSTNDGQSRDLPLVYEPPMCCGLEPIRRDLQWSQDAGRLLVRGKEPDRDYPRWYILDSYTLELVSKTASPGVREALQGNLWSGNDATLSPDGRWFVTSYLNMEEAERYTAITSLETGQEIEIGEGLIELWKWSP